MLCVFFGVLLWKGKSTKGKYITYHNYHTNGTYSYGFPGVFVINVIDSVGNKWLESLGSGEGGSY